MKNISNNYNKTHVCTKIEQMSIFCIFASGLFYFLISLINIAKILSLPILIYLPEVTSFLKLVDHHHGVLSIYSLYAYKYTDTFINNIHYCVLYLNILKRYQTECLISKVFYAMHFFHSALCVQVLTMLKHITLAHLFNFTVIFHCMHKLNFIYPFQGWKK